MKQKKKLLRVLTILLAIMISFINIDLKIASADVDGVKTRSITALDGIFIGEENYETSMNEVIIPYLDSIMEEGNIQGEDNVELYYRKYKVENSIGNIVISHGFGEFIERYYELIYYFTNKGYNVFMMEHRGHGRSGRLGIADETQMNVEDFSQYISDLKKFLDEVVVNESNGDDLFLYGHSMGGAIGANFLIDHPGYFDAAILNAPMMTVHTGKVPLFVADIIASTAELIGLGGKYAPGRAPYTANYSIESSGTSSQERFDTLLDIEASNVDLQRGGPSLRWLNEAIDIGKYITDKDNASKIEIPVVLFQAGKDDFVKDKGQNDFAKYAKNCKLIRLDEAKHEIYREADSINKDVIENYIDFYNSHNVK